MPKYILWDKLYRTAQARASQSDRTPDKAVGLFTVVQSAQTFTCDDDRLRSSRHAGNVGEGGMR